MEVGSELEGKSRAVLSFRQERGDQRMVEVEKVEEELVEVEMEAGRIPQASLAMPALHLEAPEASLTVQGPAEAS